MRFIGCQHAVSQVCLGAPDSLAGGYLNHPHSGRVYAGHAASANPATVAMAVLKSAASP